MEDLIRLFHQLETQRFYGSLEVKFEAGHIVLLKKSETLKPMQSTCGDNRGTYERTQSR